jgi:hypothetical protein
MTLHSRGSTSGEWPKDVDSMGQMFSQIGHAWGYARADMTKGE